MRNRSLVAGVVTGLLLLPMGLCAQQDALSMVRSAVKKSTLDQAGTPPFHMHARLAPTMDRDLGSGRKGEIEIWWQAPGRYRRELHAPGFHQVEIVDGTKVWQKNEGDYLPSWLDEVANALLRPLPTESLAMQGIGPDKSMEMAGSIYLNWEKPLPMDMQPSKQVVALNAATGRFFYGNGLGWGFLFKDYVDFHGREVPLTVSDGSPEVTARVDRMEKMPHVPGGWFDASAPGGDPQPLRFVAIDKTNLTTDLAGPVPALVWPEVPGTRAEGTIWVDLVLDREGKIREPFKTISDNPAINDFMHGYLEGLQFKPVVRDGVAVQVIRHVVFRFELGKAAVFSGTAAP